MTERGVLGIIRLGNINPDVGTPGLLPDQALRQMSEAVRHMFLTMQHSARLRGNLP